MQLASIEILLTGHIPAGFASTCKPVRRELAKTGTAELTHPQRNCPAADCQGSWPRLKDLSISRFAPLTTYPQLQDFALTRLDPLQEAKWPLLSTLTAAGWNCIHLSMANQQCRWPQLSDLTISHINVGSQASSLKALTLGGVTRPDCLLNVLAMDLPALEQLYVNLRREDDAYGSPDVAARLALQGVWAALKHLGRQTNSWVGHHFHPCFKQTGQTCGSWICQPTTCIWCPSKFW